MIRVQQLSELEEVHSNLLMLFHVGMPCLNDTSWINTIFYRSLTIVLFLLETLLLNDDGLLFVICGLSAYKGQREMLR